MKEHGTHGDDNHGTILAEYGPDEFNGLFGHVAQFDQANGEMFSILGQLQEVAAGENVKRLAEELAIAYDKVVDGLFNASDEMFLNMNPQDAKRGWVAIVSGHENMLRAKGFELTLQDLVKPTPDQELAEQAETYGEAAHAAIEIQTSKEEGRQIILKFEEKLEKFLEDVLYYTDHGDAAMEAFRAYVPETDAAPGASADDIAPEPDDDAALEIISEPPTVDGRFMTLKAIGELGKDAAEAIVLFGLKALIKRMNG